MPGKRIVFSTNTPNDQGFRIPNNVLDFGRYEKNPVLLSQHNWDDWKKDLLGKMTDIQYDNGEWTGVPIFHKKNEDSQLASDLWEEGFLTACSIGGFKELKTTGKIVRDADGNQVPEIWRDNDGLAVATNFEIYEISMVSIPSNLDAVQKKEYLSAHPDLLNAKCYDEINIKALEKEVTTLNSKLKAMDNEELEAAKKLVKEAEEKEQKEKADKLAADQRTAAKLKAEKDEEKAKKEKADKEAADKKKKADDLPEPIAEEVEKSEKKSGLASFFAGLANLLGGTSATALEGSLYELDGKKPAVLDPPKATGKPDKYDSKEADKKLFNELEEKVGKMKAKEQKAEELKTAYMKASVAMSTALEAKEKAEKEGATDEEKDEYLAAKKDAELATELCDKMESDMEDDDMSDDMKAEKKKKKEKEELAAKLSANKIRVKTRDELAADKIRLAAKPNISDVVKFTNRVTTLSAMKKDPEGQKIIDRVTHQAEGTRPEELAYYMSAMRNEPKYKPIFDKTRIILGATEHNYKTYRANSQSNPGVSPDEIIARLAAGKVNWLDKSTMQMTERTTLTATDNFLASPDLFAMDFLDLAIFKLFPTSSWKNDIPIFGATSTENNTGLIWANIAANPAIYMGNQPVNPAAYTYNDTAVALNLTPFWMQPMLWTPLYMAQLRYDQMSTGWAQGFATMGTYIDDYLLYTLGSSVPHSSIVYSSGISPNPNGGNTPVQSFVLNGNGDNPYAFYYNTLFQGTLYNPTLNDVLMPELIYNKQNYDLDNERPVLVIDPTTNTLIKQTSQSQSLLTRWVDDSGKDQLAFSHTRFNQRSRVLAFNPQTAQVLSPFSIIPSVATSANLGFIPSQVGIGISNLDVFMIQSPTDYGYKMSADVRMGITPLRANANGVSILAYSPEIIS